MPGNHETTSSSSTYHFTSEDMDKLSENEHFRCFRSSPYVGHALVRKEHSGEFSCYQFEAPEPKRDETPNIIHLENIRILKPFEDIRAEATGVKPDGSKIRMVSMRHLRIDVELANSTQREENELLVFSPRESHEWKGDVFWGGCDLEPEVFNQSVNNKELSEELSDVSLKKETYKQAEIEVVPTDIPIRDGMKRTKSQNEVMGQFSAVDEYERVLNVYGDELSGIARAHIEKGVELRDSLRDKNIPMHQKMKRPEWNHLAGHGLTPMHSEPQDPNNLGAAPAWHNTLMRTTERPTKWFALNRPQSVIRLRTQFKMIPGTDIVHSGAIEASICEARDSNPTEKNTIYILQHLYPMQKFPKYMKPSDIMQVTMVAQSLLKDRDARDISIAVDARHLNLSQIQESKGNLNFSSQTTHAKKGTSMTPRKRISRTSSESLFKDLSLDESDITPHIEKLRTAMRPSSNRPTYLEHEMSVVDITTSSIEYNFAVPYNASSGELWKGSGFVIEHNGTKYVMTNAHVVENPTALDVRFGNTDTRYSGNVMYYDTNVDCAILEIKDEEFQENAVPVELGDMVSLNQAVSVIGFPAGGDEICQTSGTVSRIEVIDYFRSDLDMLTAQTTAPINPGNSGGPIFSDGKVVGIAFQCLKSSQNTAYMIPAPVFKHVLKDAFSSKPSQRGFPYWGVEFQSITRQEYKKIFKLKKNESGIRITSIDKLLNPNDNIQIGDILMEIDGHRISGDGKIKIDGIGDRISYDFLPSRKYIGDSISLKVKRFCKKAQNYREFIFDIPLQYRWLETKLVPGILINTAPTYYVNCGLVFSPLTRNFMESPEKKQHEYAFDVSLGNIGNTDKDDLDKQAVVLVQVLANSHIRDISEDLQDTILIHKVNGHKINHIRDLIAAFESNEGELHQIELNNNFLLPIKNISRVENNDILDFYNIKNDRSSDLREDDSHELQLSKPKKSILQTTPVDNKVLQREIQKAAQKALMSMLISQTTKSELDDNDEELFDQSEAEEDNELDETLSQFEELNASERNLLLEKMRSNTGIPGRLQAFIARYEGLGDNTKDLTLERPQRKQDVKVNHNKRAIIVDSEDEEEIKQSESKKRSSKRLKRMRVS